MPFKSGLTKAQQRLKILSDPKKGGRLKRFRPTIEEPYIYYAAASQKKAQYEHQVAVNWVYIWFMRTLQSWEKLYRFDYAQNYGVLECDGFVTKRNTWTGEHWFYFVEVEVANHSPFDKVAKYNRLYEEEKYIDWWWAPLASGFPKILIVCAEHKRMLEAKRAVDQDKAQRGDEEGLEFVVRSLDELKGEIVKNESLGLVSTPG